MVSESSHDHRHKVLFTQPWPGGLSLVHVLWYSSKIQLPISQFWWLCFWSKTGLTSPGGPVELFILFLLLFLSCSKEEVIAYKDLWLQTQNLPASPEDWSFLLCWNIWRGILLADLYASLDLCVVLGIAWMQHHRLIYHADLPSPSHLCCFFSAIFYLYL